MRQCLARAAEQARQSRTEDNNKRNLSFIFHASCASICEIVRSEIVKQARDDGAEPPGRGHGQHELLPVRARPPHGLHGRRRRPRALLPRPGLWVAQVGDGARSQGAAVLDVDLVDGGPGEKLEVCKCHGS